MLQYRNISDIQTGEGILSLEDLDFEFMNPIEYYMGSFVTQQMIIKGVPINEINREAKPTDKSRDAFIESLKLWKELFDHLMKIQIPDNLFRLLESNKKKEQDALLKRIVLTPSNLMAFIFKAHLEFNYTFSQYTSEHSQKGFDFRKAPLAWKIQDSGEIKAFGKTELTNGQLKQAIEHRKFKTAKFLDNGEKWHCFITTNRSINGDEKWLGKKQPHYHYISNYYGIERNKVIQQIKSEKYELGNLPHIKLEEFGNQPL